MPTNAAVKADAERMAQLEAKKEHAESALNKIMLVIPQMIDPSRAHRAGRQLQRGGAAVRRAKDAGL